MTRNLSKPKALPMLVFFLLWWGITGPSHLYGQKRPAPLVVSYSALVASQSYLWIAKEAGFFERNGLDVKMVFIVSGAQNVAALLAGDVDVAIIGGMGVMRAKLAGGELYLIGGTKNQMAGSIVANPRIKTVADLKGKKIAITRRGSNPEYMARAALLRFGINPDRDVTFIQAGGAPETVAALHGGGVEAASIIPPHNLRAISLGYKELIDVTAMKIPFVATIIATTKKNIDTKASVILPFMQAIADGVHKFQTDKAYALKVISKYTRTPINEDLEVTYGVEGGIMDRNLNVHNEAIQATLEEIRKDVPKAAQAKPEDFVDLRFVNSLKQSGYLDRLWK
jgi:NitT/TauT family transport system substrate-binding protein